MTGLLQKTHQAEMIGAGLAMAGLSFDLQLQTAEDVLYPSTALHSLHPVSTAQTSSNMEILVWRTLFLGYQLVAHVMSI